MLGVSNEVMIASGFFFYKIITSATELLTSRGIKNRVINLRHERNSVHVYYSTVFRYNNF